MAQVTLYDASDPGTFVIFPVTPSPEVNDASVKLSWSVARRGGISRPHGRNERTYSFNAVLPGWADAYMAYTANYQHPEDILQTLRSWHAPVAKQGTKLRLVIQREHEVQDASVYIDTLKATPDVRGGYVVALSLTEWRTLLVLLDGEQDGAAGGGADSDALGSDAEPAPPDTPDQYAVQDGDTLYDIAASQLGDGERWPEIAELNGIDDPDNLEVGAVLQLPSSSPGQADTNDADQDQ